MNLLIQFPLRWRKVLGREIEKLLRNDYASENSPLKSELAILRTGKAP
jgi:hypothetical protein